MGMSGPQPISLSEIKTFIEMEELSQEDDVELFTDCVLAMDRVFLKWCAEQAKKKTKK